MTNSTSANQPTSNRQVQRGWLERGTTTVSSASQNYSNVENTMMQRWLEEPMREQPYNNIGAVAKSDDKERICTNAYGASTTTGGRTVGGSQRRA